MKKLICVDDYSSTAYDIYRESGVILPKKGVTYTLSSSEIPDN